MSGRAGLGHVIPGLGDDERMGRNMPDATELARQAEPVDEVQWFQFLDAIDEVARRRRNRTDVPDEPAGPGRDQVAEWVARQHLIVDPSVREIWYLPAGASDDVIRLLEVNDHLGGPDGRAQAFQSHTEGPGGIPLRLLVADNSTDQLEEIQQDPLGLLPAGWSLEGHRAWRRRD
jgi:hypothetical protein